MREPNFMIIGAAKAATTSLASLLSAHPQSAIVEGKEPHYFSHDYEHLPYDRYLHGYRGCSDEIAIGDGSTSYSRIRYHPGVVERIHRKLPHAKIIYMVRHPLDRIESAYMERAASGTFGGITSINQAVRQIPMMVDSSRYWEVFDAYRQVFGEAQVRVVWFEQFVADTAGSFADICRFLGIDPGLGMPDETYQKNSRSTAHARAAQMGVDTRKLSGELDDTTRRELVALLREDNMRLLEHFGKPVDHWDGVFTEQ